MNSGKMGLSRDAVLRLMMGKFFAGDQSKGRELQIVIFGDLLEKQLSEATCLPAPSWAYRSSSQCFSGCLLNVNELPRTSRKRERDLVKTI